MSYGAQRRATDLADAFSKGVGCRKDLLGLLIQKQMVIAEVWTGYVPVEVLGLNVESKCVGQ